jgi:hypothetical protein
MVWWCLVGVGAVVSVVLAVGGVAAIRTGWLPRWMGKRTFRPRLWGYGALLQSTNFALQLVVWVIPSPHSQDLLRGAGFVLLLVALGLLQASQQSGRTR